MATATGTKQNDILTTVLTLMFGGLTGLGIMLSAILLKSLLPEMLAWQFSRATAIVSYLLLSISMMWGLVLSTKISKEITPAPAVFAVHNAVSWAALALALIHPLTLLFDTYFTFNIFHLLIPFIDPYSPLWVGLGVISFYGLLLTTLSFDWKKKIGHENWRRIHWLTFPTYILVTIHGFMAGSDSAAISAVYVFSVGVVLFLTNYRLLTSGRKKLSK